MKQEGQNRMNSGETKLVCNSKGKWETYDDRFDIVIHCKNEEEQKKAREVLKASQTWIPVTERVPGDDRYVLLSFSNFSLPAVGRYEDGTFYVGDCDEPISEYGFYVNAWMELPESYRGEAQE